jgi:hypothetical protein
MTMARTKRSAFKLAKLTAAVVAAALVSATTTTVAASPLSHARHSARAARAHRKKHRAPRNGSVSPGLRSAFAVFRLPPQSDSTGAGAASTTTTPGSTTAPPLPPEIASEMVAGGDNYQLDLAAIQGVVVSGRPVWVIPESTGGCITWTQQGRSGNTVYPAVCGPTANLEAHGLVGGGGTGIGTTVQERTEPAATCNVVGLAPDASGDSVTALEPDGTKLSLPVLDNIYQWQGPCPMLPDSINLVAANGQPTVDTIP